MKNQERERKLSPMMDRHANPEVLILLKRVERD